MINCRVAAWCVAWLLLVAPSAACSSLVPEPVRYAVLMQAVTTTTDHAEPSQPEDDRVRLLRAVAQGLADDAAGRVMDTRALKESLEREVGPIAWP
ncbi:MAG: hypothetical protein ACMG6S_27265 [Byssovorax sp.]